MIPLRSLKNIKQLSESSFAKLLARWGDRPVRIWSDQWDAFWRPGGIGYTDDPEQAGRWSFAEAYAATKSCGDEKQIRFGFLPPAMPAEEPYGPDEG